MTPFVLVFSFFVAAATPPPPAPADAPSVAKPATRRCASALLPPIQVPRVPVSFEVPKSKEKPKILAPFLEQSKAKRNCDGTWCGCDLDQEACLSECDPNDGNCHLACAHAYTRCAVCCCCDCPYCPQYCGC